MSKSQESPEMASSNIPEWRRAAMPSLASNRFKPQKSSKRRTQLEAEETGADSSRQEIPIEVQERSSSPRKSGPTPETSLQSLGFDIWSLISCYLPKSALISICQTSPLLYSIIVPVLYHTIDLSVHAPPDGVTVSFIYRRQTCEKQYMFLRQILRKPEYGQHVRSLKWTLGLEDEKLGFKPKYLQGERVMWRNGDREKVFEYLNKVVSLDIDSATKDGVVIGEGKDLFPAAQLVHLVSSNRSLCSRSKFPTDIPIRKRKPLDAKLTTRIIARYLTRIVNSVWHRQSSSIDFAPRSLPHYSPGSVPLDGHCQSIFIQQLGPTPTTSSLKLPQSSPSCFPPPMQESPHTIPHPPTLRHQTRNRRLLYLSRRLPPRYSSTLFYLHSRRHEWPADPTTFLPTPRRKMWYEEEDVERWAKQKYGLVLCLFYHADEYRS